MPDSPQLPQSLQFLVRSRRAARIATWRGRLWAVFWIGLIIVIAIVAPWFLGAGWRTGAIDVKYVWVQMLPDEDGLLGGRLARAIVTKSDRCPDVSQDGRTVNMVRRPSPLQSTFPILICEAKLRGDSDAWIGLRRLPPRPHNPQDVVVIGDTGCRMVYWEIQSCLSDDGWPFAAVAERAASRIKDDGHQFVVIHVGDYHYRENPCADQSKKCGGSPYGDNWETWEEEFFKPASPLLLVAPWVIMRGNHEDCARAGAGWIFFFGLPGSNGDDACEHELDSYTLAFGQAGSRPRVLTVLDTANSRSPYKIEDRCEIYRRWIMHIDDQVPIVWLALHQPLLSRSPDGVQSAIAAEDDGCKQGDTTDALKVIRALLLSSPLARTVRLVLSGDTHVFQFFQPTNSERPIQIIAGMGGTALDKFKLLPKDENAKPADTKNDRARDEDVTSYGVTGGVLTIAKHGFVIMHNEGQSWTVKLVDAAGEILATCYFSEASSPNRPTNAGPDCDDKLGMAVSSGGDGSPFP